MARIPAHEPLTEQEMEEFKGKLSAFAEGLSPKEQWLLTEAVNNGIATAPPGEVQGYEEGSIYFPLSAAAEFSVLQGQLVSVAKGH
jgi:hypothetical protein